MTVQIEAQEVLAHLNRMGYTDVTAEQLKKFIGDLKRLIKYDLKQCGCAVSSSNTTPGSSYILSKVDVSNCDSSSVHDGPDGDIKEVHSIYVTKNPDQDEETDRPDTADGSTCEESSSMEPMDSKYVGAKKCSKIENRQSRARSFIKPWNLEVSATYRRSDPVALYHKYQSMWQQQKVPGDNPHVQLRWNVREKMLGGDPHRRPVTSAASLERIHSECPLRNNFREVLCMKIDLLCGILLLIDKMFSHLRSI